MVTYCAATAGAARQAHARPQNPPSEPSEPSAGGKTRGCQPQGVTVGTGLVLEASWTRMRASSLSPSLICEYTVRRCLVWASSWSQRCYPHWWEARLTQGLPTGVVAWREGAGEADAEAGAPSSLTR